MAFRRGYGQQPTFRESLEYDTQLREQVKVYRDYSNVGDEEGMMYAADTLMQMVTPDISDQEFLDVMTKEEHELEQRQAEVLEQYYLRVKAAGGGCAGMVPSPNGMPDKIYLQGKFQHIVHLFQRHGLLLRQKLHGAF